MSKRNIILYILIVILIILIRLVLVSYLKNYAPNESEDNLDDIDLELPIYDSLTEDVLDDAEINVQVDDNLEYTVVDNKITSYYEDMFRNKKIMIELGDYEDNEDGCIDSHYKIYDDLTYIAQISTLVGDVISKKVQIGKVNINLKDFENKIALNVSDMMQFNYDDDIDTMTIFGITYYKNDKIYYIQMGSEGFEKLKGELLNYDYTVEKQSTINGNN